MLKGALIGLGRMGMTHYSILNSHPDVDFISASDPSRSLISVFDKYSDMTLYYDYKEMLTCEDLDFIIITTPSALHYETVKMSLENSNHVFVEKPFVVDSNKGFELLDLAEEKKLVTQVGYFLRFNEIFNEVKSVIKSGLLGEIYSYKNEMHGRTVLKPSKSSWRSKKTMGGGCLFDFGSHCFDLSHFLFDDIKAVSLSAAKSIFSRDVEDFAIVSVIHENKINGTVTVNWCDSSYRRPYNKIEILGSNGKIIADRQEYRLYLNNPCNGFEKGWNVKYLPGLERQVRFSVRGSAFSNELDYFIENIKNQNIKNICSFSEAIKTDLVIDKLKKTNMKKEAVYG